MKKNEIKNEIARVIKRSKVQKIDPILARFEARISGKRGAEDARDRFFASLEKLYIRAKNYPDATYFSLAARDAARLQSWKVLSAEALAQKAGLQSDEHGSWKGDHVAVSGVDFVGHWQSAAAPYHDTGAEGLGLVSVARTRIYATAKLRPSNASTTFLVGRNEAGTYFSHTVSPNCYTVIDAMQWIWSGKAYQIIQRQGDIALIGSSGGPKMPSRLPASHKIQDAKIVHDTHPSLPLPKKGERIIVGHRAAERAIDATRD